MAFPKIFYPARLWLLAGLSTLMLLILPWRAHAHEVLPTIADVTVSDAGEIRLDLRVILEAFLAGVDLDAITDTNEDSASDNYDALRALPPAELEALLPALIEAWNAVPLVSADGQAVPLAISEVTVPGDVDFALPRVSEVTLTGMVPESAAAMIFTWPAGAGEVVLRQQGVEAPYTGYLSGGSATPPISLTGGDAQSSSAAFMTYIPVGFDHILPKGLDHILFVLGLFFLSTRWGPLLWQVSAFTLAHTVTLALGALGWVNLPGSIVEPLIAASIVYVAVENLFQHNLSRWRPAVVFGFGLLHGLGFASVLEEFGLPEDQFIPALIGFNVGVELGQLTVIALAAFLLWGCARIARHSDLTEAEQPAGNYAVMFRAVSIPASLIIAIIGAYWCVERVFF